MPIYEYRCLKCNFLEQKLENINAPTCRVCPKCNGVSRRILSETSPPIFKGSGFYVTDYKKKNKKE